MKSAHCNGVEDMGKDWLHPLQSKMVLSIIGKSSATRQNLSEALEEAKIDKEVKNLPTSQKISLQKF